MNAVVIGGGVAGLAAANALADRGVGTTLLETKTRLGGRAATTEKDGFLLNQGPHGLYLKGAGTRILRSFKIEPPGKPPSFGAPVAVRDSRLHPLPTGMGSMFTTSLLSLNGKMALGKWFSSLSMTKPAAVANLSVTEWLERRIKQEDARALAAAMTRIVVYSADLGRLSADSAVSQLKLAMKPANVRYVDGGWQSIVGSLARRACGRGVHIEVGAGVVELRRNRDLWIAATRDAEFAADAVIVAVGGPEATRKVIEGLTDTASWHVGPAAELAVLDLGLRQLPVPTRRFATGVDAPFYFSVHSPPAALAAEGQVLATVAAYLPDGQLDAGSRDRLEAFADQVQPGWREVVQMSRYLRHMTVCGALPTPEMGGMAGRVRPELLDAPGLFIAGDWVGQEGLLSDTAIASGVQAAKAAMSTLQGTAA
jgi:phytoene dehydrogenase-like protein